MLLKKIILENIRSYESQEVLFPSGSTLLSGDIGSGKTTILLAIEFALFGLQPSQKGSSLLRTNKDTGKVILEFEIDNKTIVIERSLKRSKKSVSQENASITIDGERFEASVTEIKNKVLNLLNYPSEFSKRTNLLYKFTVYTPQEEMKQIILEAGDVRLNTLRHVFGIEKYKRVQENATMLGSKLREKIRITEALISELDNDKKNLVLKIISLEDLKLKQIQINEEYQSSVKSREAGEKGVEEIRIKIDEKRLLENEKAKVGVILREKEQQRVSQTNTLDSIKQQIQEASKIQFDEEEYNALDKRVEFQQNKEDELHKEYMDIVGRINSLNSKKTEAEQLKVKISNLENCPTCLQEVSNEYKENILANTEEVINNSEKMIIQLTEKKNKIIEELNDVKRIKEDFKERKSHLEILKIKLESLKEKEQRVQEINQQIQTLNNDIQICRGEIIELEKSIKGYEKYDEIFSQRTEELNLAKQLENQNAIKRAETNKEIQFTEQLIKDIEKQIEKKEVLQGKIHKLRELEDWVSNKFLDLVLFTEKQVMMTLKEEFSKLFSDWFSTLVSESLSARLDDDFAPVIEQQDYELDYSFLSGGERTAVALAYRLALNQVINSLLSNLKTNNLVILDEPTDGFSAQQLDKIRDVLGQLKTEQLILVSHEPKIEGFVDNIVRVVKGSGVSLIEG